MKNNSDHVAVDLAEQSSTGQCESVPVLTLTDIAWEYLSADDRDSWLAGDSIKLRHADITGMFADIIKARAQAASHQALVDALQAFMALDETFCTAPEASLREMVANKVPGSEKVANAVLLARAALTGAKP